MMRVLIAVFSVAFAIFSTAPAYSEILAMMNYESKSKAALKKLKISGTQKRVEGIAIVDVDPNSPGFGKIVTDIPLPADLVAHHIFYDKTMTKAYITSLGKSLIYVMDMKRNPYRLKKIDIPACKVGEDVVFSGDNSTWYLTCMGSGNVVVGDVRTDQIKTVIPLPRPYPHGIAVHDGIDRILVTETVRASDLGDAGETVTVIQASTNKVLSTHKISKKTSPSREAPVEVVFMPNSNPPVAYITNMFGGTLWRAAWQPGTKTFQFSQAYDFGKKKIGIPLEIYFNTKADRLFVTTAKPGHLHIFDSSNPKRLKLMRSFPAAGGAHHVAFTKDEKYAFVQNALLNLPGMSDGSVTVVDLQKGKVVRSMDTLKRMGLNPNSIVLLPKWNHLAGH